MRDRQLYKHGMGSRSMKTEIAELTNKLLLSYHEATRHDSRQLNCCQHFCQRRKSLSKHNPRAGDQSKEKDHVMGCQQVGMGNGWNVSTSKDFAIMLAYTAVDMLCVQDMENNVSQTLYKHCYNWCFIDFSLLGLSSNVTVIWLSKKWQSFNRQTDLNLSFPGKWTK